MKRRKKKVNILLKLAPDVARLLDKKCGGPARGGKKGGRADYLRQLLYRDIGIPFIDEYHGRGPRDIDIERMFPYLLKPLDPIAAEVLGLVKQGHSYRRVARHMTSKGIKTPRGRNKWSAQTVRATLERAAKVLRVDLNPSD